MERSTRACGGPRRCRPPRARREAGRWRRRAAASLQPASRLDLDGRTVGKAHLPLHDDLRAGLQGRLGNLYPASLRQACADALPVGLALRHDSELRESGDVIPQHGWGRNDRHLLPHSYGDDRRSEEHTSELQSLTKLVCRLLLEKKKSSDLRASSNATMCSSSWASMKGSGERGSPSAPSCSWVRALQ